MHRDISYWDSFYNKTDLKLSIPSQFAVFIGSQFIGEIDTILDVGCGNGRDSLFFLSLGLNVVGIDASKNAIDHLNNKEHVNGEFLEVDICNISLHKSINNRLNNSKSKLIYSRFFIHAINDDDETAFWSFVRNICSTNDYVALEFRTHRDESLSKATESHFRRFVNPSGVLSRAHSLGFNCIYYVEGFGFAKYKNDDAHVARIVLKG